MRSKEFIRRPAVEAFADLVNKEKEIATNKSTPVKQPPGFDYNAAAKMAGVKPVVPKDQQVGQDKQTVPGTSLTPPNADIGTQSSTGGQTFNIPTGIVHRAAPNNPNNAQSTALAPNTNTTSAPAAQVPNTKAISGPGAAIPALGLSPTVPTASPTTPPKAAPAAPASAAPTATATPKAAPASAAPTATPTASPKTAAAPASSTPAAAPASSTPAAAPSLGAPTAVQAQQAKQAQAPSSNKSTGFLAGLSKGFTTGMGGREGETLTQLATRKAASGLGLHATAQALGTMPKAGTSVNDPKLGKLTVQPPDARHPNMISVKTADGRTIFMDPDSL